MRKRRWSDNDYHFGPFTFAYENNKYWKPIAVILSSGDDEYPGCSLRLQGFGMTLIAELPPILPPQRYYVDLSGYEWANNGGYWQVEPREYGFSLNEGFLQVFLGPHTMDSETDKTWCKFLPWTQWRHVRHSLYDTEGNHFWTEPQKRGLETFNEYMEMKEACPSVSFEFYDFDDEKIKAKTIIEELEWLFGEGWFKWLSLFRKPRIHRGLDIEFSSEVGREKGSWKGGTVGHSIDLLNSDELHESAFKRYCNENNLTYIGMLKE